MHNKDNEILCKFGHTFLLISHIITTVKTPNTLYSFLLHPIVKNTFSLKWQPTDGCHFFCA